MDRFGSLRCLEYLYLKAPWLLKKCIIVFDGDMKGSSSIGEKRKQFEFMDGVKEGTYSLFIGRCYTHIIKNIFKFMDTTLAKVKCTCESKSSRNHRCTHPLPRSAAGFVSKIISLCLKYYVPPPGACDRNYDFGDRRRAACEYFKVQLDICLEHLCGRHGLCEHGESRNEPKFFCCSAQLKALRSYFDGLKDKVSEILTPGGKVHIQHCESNNSMVVRFRPKGDLSFGPIPNFLAETLAFLNVMELQLGFNGERFSSLVRISQCVKFHFGFTFDVDLLNEEALLEKRIKEKEYRCTELFRVMVGRYRARKRNKKVEEKKKKGKDKVVGSGGYVPVSDRVPEGCLMEDLENAFEESVIGPDPMDVEASLSDEENSDVIDAGGDPQSGPAEIPARRWNFCEHGERQSRCSECEKGRGGESWRKEYKSFHSKLMGAWPEIQ